MLTTTKSYEYWGIDAMSNPIAPTVSVRSVHIATLAIAATLLSLAAAPAVAQSAQAQKLIEDFGLREARQPVRDMPNWKVPEKVVVWQNADRLPALSAAFPSITFESVGSVDALPAALAGTNSSALTLKLSSKATIFSPGSKR